MIPPEDYEEAREQLEARAPNFIRAIESARERGAFVSMLVDAFMGEPDLLEHALWYARCRGVRVEFGALDPEE